MFFFISLSGLASGASTLGVATCAIFMALGSLRVNDKGFTISIIIGTIKLLMPNFFKNPILALPLVLSGLISGACGALLNIKGDSSSAGFGLIGLIGPIKSIEIAENTMLGILNALLAFGLIPLVSCFLMDFIFRRVFKLYNLDVFKEIK